MSHVCVCGSACVWLLLSTIAISVKRQSLFEFEVYWTAVGEGPAGRAKGAAAGEKLWKVKQATSCEQLANYALQLLTVAGAAAAAAPAAAAAAAAPLPQAEPLNDLQVKWIITTANA